MDIEILPQYWSCYMKYVLKTPSDALIYPAYDAAETTQRLLKGNQLDNIRAQSAASFLGIGGIEGLTRNQIRKTLRNRPINADYLSMTYLGLGNQRVWDYFALANKVLAVFRFGPEGEESSHAFGAIRHPKILMPDGSYQTSDEFAVWDVGAKPPWFYRYVSTQQVLEHIAGYFTNTPQFKTKQVELYGLK